MSPPRFLLVTATDPSEAARANLDALVSSVERQGVEGDHVIVRRGGGRQLGPGYASMRVHELSAPLETSLSRARNMALEHARREGLLERAAMVAFPDDDCVYPDGLLQDVARLLGDGDALLAIPYAPSQERIDRRRFPATSRRLSPGRVMRSVSSGGTFLTAAAVHALGDFDERFGLGARFGASEDTDYALRALSAGMGASYRGDGAIVLHPYKPSRPAQYYLGNVAVLAKHARRGGTALLLLRRLLYGALLGARGRLRGSDYRRALRAAAEQLRGDAPTRRSGRSPRTSAQEL